MAEPASALICVIPTGVGGELGQQLQLQGGQVSPAGQAGQAQPQPPPTPAPPSDVTTGCIFAQTPLGQGVVKQAIPRDVHPHWSAVSATHDFASVYAVQGSGGGDVQSHGAQAVLAGHAGHAQMAVAVPVAAVVVPLVVVAGPAVPVPVGAIVIVVVAPPVHEQLQAGHALPAGHSGQLQVQVPGPPPVPEPPPVPVPHPPPAPPAPPPVPH